MPPINAAYLEHQRKHWMRPDAHLFVRPDWRKFVPPELQAAHPFALYEKKYRPDQARVPAGSREGGQWTDEEGGGGGSDPRYGEDENAQLPRNARPTQFRLSDERSSSAEELIQSGGEDLGSFSDGVYVAKGPNISHQESFDPATGMTILSFSGIGRVVVDEKVGQGGHATGYTVGTPSKPDEGLSVTIDRSGKVRAYPSFGG
jgi:hypothetical protein